MDTRKKTEINELKELCETLELFDEIKEQLNDIDLSVRLDKLIYRTEVKLGLKIINMLSNDRCNCDGIHEGCSSYLCLSQYNKMFNTDETTDKKKQTV